MSAVVLAGGSSRRFGSDKTRAPLANGTVLDALLDSLPPDWPIVCVGEERPTTRSIEWTREEPPGGGPVAAVAAALPLVHTETLVLLGGDMPFAGPSAAHLAHRLTDVVEGQESSDTATDVVVARDHTGRTQPLLAAYRTTALASVVPSQPAGIPLMSLLDRLRLLPVDLPSNATFDVDTPEQLDAARRRLAP